MRLTNAIRNKIIDTITKPLEKKNSERIQFLQAARKTAAQSLVEQGIPRDLLEIAKKYPGYIKQDNDVRFKRECWTEGSSSWWGPHAIRITIDSPLPCAEDFFAMGNDENIEVMTDEINALEKELIRLKSDIGDCLACCSSTAQVIERLPEAADAVRSLEGSGLPVPVTVFSSLNAELARLRAAAKEE